MSNDSSKFDVRVIERNLAKKEISSKELAAHMKGLPDVINKGVKVESGGALDPADFTSDD